MKEEIVISKYNQLKGKAVTLRTIGKVIQEGCQWDIDELDSFLINMPEYLQEDPEILSAIEYMVAKLYNEIFNN